MCIIPYFQVGNMCSCPANRIVHITGHYKKLITNSIFKNVCGRKVLTRKKNMTVIGLKNIVKNELDISLFGYRQMCHVRLSFLLVVVYFTDHTNLSQQS